MVVHAVGRIFSAQVDAESARSSPSLVHSLRVVGFASTASTASTSGTNRLNPVEVVEYWVEA